MKATILKIEGELAVVIPQDLLSALDIDENTPLSVEVDGGRLVVTPEKKSTDKFSLMPLLKARLNDMATH